MYIMNAAITQIINAEFVERFCIAEKPDAVLVVASYSAERQPVTMARYKNLEEAQGNLRDLMLALASGQLYYTMPESLLYAEEPVKKDARTKRKGGS